MPSISIHFCSGDVPVGGWLHTEAVADARPWKGELVDAQRGWYITGVTFTIDLEREEDGRWIAEVLALPGVLCYGHDRDEAVACVQALALRVIAERLENREAPAEFINVTFQAA